MDALRDVARMGTVVLAACAALSPLAARAQISVTSDASTSSGVVNIGQQTCTDNRAINFTYDLGTPPALGESVTVWVTKDTATCTATNDPAAPNRQLTTPSQTFQRATVQAKPSDLFLDLKNGCANTDATAAQPFTTSFCVRRKSQTFTGTTVVAGTLQINFALVGPKAPSAPAVEGGDEQLRVSWTSNDTGDSTYEVHVVRSGTSFGDLSGTSAKGVATTRADVSKSDDGARLQNGVSYDVAIRSVDVYGNFSALSAPSSGKPVQVDDFYNHYRDAGGSALGGGGCASAGSSGALVFAVLSLGLLLRRRRRAERSLGSDP